MSDLTGFIAATHPGFAYCGRVARSGDSYRFDWPNTEIRFSVRGTDAISVRMDGANNFFNIAIDDDPSRVLATGEGVQDYSLSEQLKPAKVHRILLTKRTEAVASFPDKKTACVLLQGVLLGAGGMLLSESFERRRVIEFVGDSDTAAYGNLGERTGFEVKDRSVFADPCHPAIKSWNLVAKTYQLINNNPCGR